MENDNFQWDDEKDNKNQDNHGISFDEAKRKKDMKIVKSAKREK
jgi:uncharacterized DUF497 family protein